MYEFIDLRKRDTKQLRQLFKELQDEQYAKASAILKDTDLVEHNSFSKEDAASHQEEAGLVGQQISSISGNCK